MRFGLRTRVALVFAVLSMVVAVLVASGIYLVSRSYLTNQRQSVALTRALLDVAPSMRRSPGGPSPARCSANCPSWGRPRP